MRICLVLLLIFAFATQSSAQDIAVAVDVSGSMTKYGGWQNDAVDALTAVFMGTAPSPRWTLTGRSSALADYQVTNGKQIKLLLFGDVQRAEFPFFDTPATFTRTSDFASGFPVGAKAFAQGRTNKTLAEMVAARLATNVAQDAYVVMVSDFLVDASLTPPQLSFLNEYQSKYAVYVLATLSWNPDPRVQIKLVKYTRQPSIEAVAPPAAEPKATVSDPSLRVTAIVGKSPQTLRLNWTFESPAQATKYSVSVRDTATGSVVFSKQNLATRTITWTDASSGSFAWTVVAELSDGSRVSKAGNVAIAGARGGGIVLVAIFGLAALGGGLWWLDRAGMLPYSSRKGRKAQSARV